MTEPDQKTTPKITPKSNQFEFVVGSNLVSGFIKLELNPLHRPSYLLYYIKMIPTSFRMRSLINDKIQLKHLS